MLTIWNNIETLQWANKALTLHYSGANLRTDSRLWPAAFYGDQVVGFHYRIDDRLLVQRPQAPQIDHLTVDTLFGQLLGRLQTQADRFGVRNQRYPIAGSLDLRLANRYEKVFAQRSIVHIERNAVHKFVLQKYHRIVITNGWL